MIYYDPLTGLANRALFYDRAHKSLARVRREESSLVILLLDLVGFSDVVEKVGRDGGDRYLRAVARNFLEDVRDTDTIARIGSNEFVIMLENVTKYGDIENVIEKLVESVNAPVTLEGEELTCTASIGISVFPEDGDSVDALLKNADRAMFSAGEQGENRYEFFDTSMSNDDGNFLLLENDLLHAVENNEFKLFFQPQFDLVSGRITGLEALVRWQNSRRGMVSPQEFVPLAEETGLIQELGEWVLYEAALRFRTWLAQGLHFGKIAVNISAHQFRLPGFEALIGTVLNNTKLAPEYLELEITESSAMENAGDAVELLKRLNAMGLSLSIDDFGTGYSSLAYLKNFPIQKLKIDKSFIQEVDTNKSDAAIAKSIIDLAHNLNLQVIAEGVERPTQARWLRDRLCDQVQGDYYSEALSEEALLALANSDRVIKDASGITLLR